MKLASKFEIKTIENEDQLKELWQLEEKAYGKENITYEKYHNWWLKYKKGIYALTHDNKIAGAIELFPIKKSAFEGIIDGTLHESEINKELIITNAQLHTDWYLGDIILDSKFRHHSISREMLTRIIEKWKDNLKLITNIRICAIVYSEKGEVILNKLNFKCTRKAENTVNNHATYLFEAESINELCY